MVPRPRPVRPSVGLLGGQGPVRWCGRGQGGVEMALHRALLPEVSPPCTHAGGLLVGQPWQRAPVP